MFSRKNIIYKNPRRKEPDCQFYQVRRKNPICYLKYFVSFHNKRFLQHIVRQLSTSHSEYYNEIEHMNQRKEYFISVIIIFSLYNGGCNKMNFQSGDKSRSKGRSVFFSIRSCQAAVNNLTLPFDKTWETF